MLSRRTMCQLTQRGSMSIKGSSNECWRMLSSAVSSSETEEDVGGLSSLFNPTEEHAALRSMLRSFVEKEVEPQALEYNRKESFNVPLFAKLGANELGILGLTVPDKYGGTYFDQSPATAVAIAHEELSYSDPAFCLSYLAHSILLVNNLYINGNEEQRLRFLPGLCGGNQIGGMCMSEPNAGTDVLGMKSHAVFDSQRNGWILNGTKMWITNGTIPSSHMKDHAKKPTGDMFLVYAKTGSNRSDLTQFIVEKNDDSGFTVGQQIHDKLGMRASPTAELVFDRVFIPADSHVVGDVNNATLCMMRNLEIERIGLAAMAIGIARRCIDEMKRYASERTAFGNQSLFSFGQIQRHIAESYADYMAGKSYVYAVANSLDLQSHGNGLDADGVKLYSAQMAKKVADRAIQVMGGYGYVGEYVVERLWRDAKLLEIGGGTNESHHKNMARDLRKMGPYNKLP